MVKTMDKWLREWPTVIQSWLEMCRRDHEIYNGETLTRELKPATILTILRPFMVVAIRDGNLNVTYGTMAKYCPIFFNLTTETAWRKAQRLTLQVRKDASIHAEVDAYLSGIRAPVPSAAECDHAVMTLLKYGLWDMRFNPLTSATSIPPQPGLPLPPHPALVVPFQAPQPPMNVQQPVQQPDAAAPSVDSTPPPTSPDEMEGAAGEEVDFEPTLGGDVDVEPPCDGSDSGPSPELQELINIPTAEALLARWDADRERPGGLLAWHELAAQAAQVWALATTPCGHVGGGGCATADGAVFPTAAGFVKDIGLPENLQQRKLQLLMGILRMFVTHARVLSPHALRGMVTYISQAFGVNSKGEEIIRALALWGLSPKPSCVGAEDLQYFREVGITMEEVNSMLVDQHGNALTVGLSAVRSEGKNIYSWHGYHVSRNSAKVHAAIALSVSWPARSSRDQLEVVYLVALLVETAQLSLLGYLHSSLWDPQWGPVRSGTHSRSVCSLTLSLHTCPSPSIPNT